MPTAQANQPILIASDHAGFALKSALIRLLRDWSWNDLGPNNEDRVDYPDFAEKLSREITRDEASLGVLICGTGIGMSIAANKVPGIRAAMAWDPVSARLSREHNDANVLCLGARFIAPEYAAEIARAWLRTPFSGDSRHRSRVAKIDLLDSESGPNQQGAW